MILNFLVFALTGKIIVFLFQKFPKSKLPFIGKLFLDGGLLEELFSCDLCLGFWIYFGLAFLFDLDLIGVDVPVLSEFITGAITTFVVHIFSVGWNAKFQNLIIE
ncbi:MAG: hypothetical protein BV458_09955 [Thermoplasmata archaeon M9B2D]|nr:MAG: hypothetical protein BV458_09955 [Thermoplasmata archaeon M9B2D]